VNYHPDDFLSLIEEVEKQGGAHLASETCKPRRFRMNLPIDEAVPTGPKRSTRVESTGCHRRAKFLVSLLADEHIGLDEDDPTDFDFNDAEHPVATMSDGGPAMVKVCAVDDAMGLWPRFERAMFTGESFQE
jgi:hypothetical protein